jgi:hypothetical protein
MYYGTEAGVGNPAVAKGYDRILLVDGKNESTPRKTQSRHGSPHFELSTDHNFIRSKNYDLIPYEQVA